MNDIAPFGSWPSPITSDLIASESIGLADPIFDGENIYWLEMRPSEGGRSVLVRRTPDGKTTDMTPPPCNVRTRVHEYGGGSFLIREGAVHFVHFDDQRLYRVLPGAAPEPITSGEGRRFADFLPDAARNRLICVCEDHTGSGREPRNTLAAVSLADGSLTHLVFGNDFYSTPRLDPDGARLCWLTWNHPNMPWDGTELWTAALDARGLPENPEKVAGGPEESIFQPEWSPDGTLFFVSDRSGWWNLHRLADGAPVPVAPMAAEFGMPQWGFGMSTYGFDRDGRILCALQRDGLWNLARIDPDHPEITHLDTPFTDIASVRVGAGEALFIGASATEPRSVVRLRIDSGKTEVLRTSFQNHIHTGHFSRPEPVTFPTTGGDTAHGILYRPKNRDVGGPAGERPPLLVLSHGGPTAAAGGAFNLTIQFWTSRGFAVFDVDYGGSTGYGRKYRDRLRGKWGVVDVDDCVNGARHLVERGEVDGDRIAIRGGSAGGFTTLAALAFRDVFKAGASRYGISDLTALAEETHKFESRYLDTLVGPYPERRDLYEARSPIHAVDRLSCPVIFFQGLEDQVVPPAQAELMVDALKQKGIPVAYLPFAGEQHGFRRSETIQRALEAELYFYGRIFGFAPADDIEPVEIHNL